MEMPDVHPAIEDVTCQVTKASEQQALVYPSKI